MRAYTPGEVVAEILTVARESGATPVESDCDVKNPGRDPALVTRPILVGLASKVPGDFCLPFSPSSMED